MDRDAGFIVLGWFTKVFLALALLGLIVYEGVSVGVAHINATDDARAAASAGSETWQQTHNVNLAFAASLSYAEEHGDTLTKKDFLALPDGTVRVTLSKQAPTLVLRHIGALRSVVDARASASIRSTPQS